MTELQKVLYDYAWEYQIPGLLRASQKEAADNDRMVEAALTRLRGLGPEGADLAQRLESGQLTRHSKFQGLCHSRFPRPLLYG